MFDVDTYPTSSPRQVFSLLYVTRPFVIAPGISIFKRLVFIHSLFELVTFTLSVAVTAAIIDYHYSYVMN